MKWYQNYNSLCTRAKLLIVKLVRHHPPACANFTETNLITKKRKRSWVIQLDAQARFNFFGSKLTFRADGFPDCGCAFHDNAIVNAPFAQPGGE
ncbi:MAG: hypothetical protein ORN98_05920 [Alphaproteobacteria bacterium]|nr:hypothetical protein [Alphaproteobacteria bacterium]